MKRNSAVIRFITRLMIFVMFFVTLRMADGQAIKAYGFSSYKAVVTASSITIRQGPSTRYRAVGSYTKGQIIDVIGQSGSYLRTSRGYVLGGYTKKYTPPVAPQLPQVSRGSGPGSYKVEITVSKLNIRQKPSSSGKVIGSYYRGNIVDVYGSSGSYLITSKGYIWASYTKVYNPPAPKPAPVDNTGKFVRMKADAPIAVSIGGAADERYAAAGKVFKILEHKSGYYKIKMGRLFGYIPEASGDVLDSYDQRVTLGWNYVYLKSSNKVYYDDAGDTVNKNSGSLGLDVVSPSWFYIEGGNDPSGIKASEKADREYTRIAHKNGYEVWALLSEFDMDRAYAMFNSTEARGRVINQIVQYSLDYNVDGVNIDFEALGSKNKDLFTSFVKELSAKLKQLNITVSVDVTKPTPYTSNIWSAGYDRPALAQQVDYLIYMAYDEHTSGSDTAGSVGSYSWVKSGIDDMLLQGVPKEKLMLGVPFYLRDFSIKEVNLPYNSVAFNSNNGGVYSQPSTDSANLLQAASEGTAYKFIGQISGYYIVEYNSQQVYIPTNSAVYIPANTERDFVIASEAISLQAALNRVSDNGGTTYLDENSRQYVGQYQKGGYKHLVWLENNYSMNWRMDFVKQYNLPGMAAWSLNWYMPDDVWDVIKSKLK